MGVASDAIPGAMRPLNDKAEQEVLWSAEPDWVLDHGFAHEGEIVHDCLADPGTRAFAEWYHRAHMKPAGKEARR